MGLLLAGPSGSLRPQNPIPLDVHPIMKLSQSLFVVFLAASKFLCAAADSPEVSKLPPPAKTTGVTYTKDIRPMFEASCFRCHSGDRPKAGLRLDSLDSVLKGSREGRVIIPGESEHSALVIAVARLDEESAMPPKGRAGGPRGGPGRPGGGGGAPPNAPGGGGFQPPKPLSAE